MRRGTALDTSQLSDEQLARQAAREASDGPAFQALLARYQERVWRICYRLMGNTEDASDAAQEVLVRMFLNRGKYAERSSYATWVHGIAVRTCLMTRRTLGRLRRREAEAGLLRAHQQGAGDDRADTSLDVMRMLEILDEEDRAMLILKYAEGYGYDELSEMFDLSVSACKMRLSRAREKLKQRFPDQYFGDHPDVT